LDGFDPIPEFKRLKSTHPALMKLAASPQKGITGEL
jgi:hypothetical protein